MSTTTTNTPTSAIRQSQILPDSGNAASAEVPPSQGGFSRNASQAPRFARPKAGARYKEPLDYAHPYAPMKRFALLLALRYNMARTRHSYYRDVRLLHEHFQSGDNEFGNRHLIPPRGLRRGAGPEGRLSGNRMRRPKSCGAA